MAKPKNPKKNHEARIATPTPSETGVTPAETTSEPVSSLPVNMSEPRKTAPRKSTMKPEIVRTESRSNLIPINIEDEIRQLAYLFSERRGFLPGHETEDWLAAEHEVLERYHHARAHQAGA